jgi:hypothetical protein
MGNGHVQSHLKESGQRAMAAMVLADFAAAEDIALKPNASQ